MFSKSIKIIYFRKKVHKAASGHKILTISFFCFFLGMGDEEEDDENE